jgi:hypothetical protein
LPKEVRAMEIEKILPFVLVPVFIVVAAGVWYLVWRAEQKRREALRQIAEQLGFELEPQADELSAREFGRFHLFTLGRGRTATNLLRGRMEHEEALLFDYRYDTGSGKNHSVHRQTVAAVSLGARAALPEFELRPENIFHKIGAAFGYQDIDFPDYPSFSSRYLVRGKDEAAVRAVFDGTVIEAVGSAKNICIEGGGSWLVIYRAGRRVDPAKIPEFLDAARALRSAFARRSEARRV